MSLVLAQLTETLLPSNPGKSTRKRTVVEIGHPCLH